MAHDIGKHSIAILGTRGIPAQYGGFETFAQRLAIGLVERGFAVTVFCEANKPDAPSIFRGIRLEYVAAPAFGPLKTVLYDLECLWKARDRYDVVYMLGYGSAIFCLIPRLFGTEVWINPDGLEWARAKWNSLAKLYFRLMEWLCLRSCDRIIADAEAIKDNLVERHGPLPHCTVIPYGCDVIEESPASKTLEEWGAERDDYYLVVCRLEPENHVLEIMQAFKKSTSRHKLIIVGDNKSTTTYVEQLKAIKDPRINMIGTVYSEDKLTSLRYYCFAYIHGHSVGGTNPSLLEAMGCGNAVLAHDNAFNRETLSDQGFFFATSKQLTDLIEAIESDRIDLNRHQKALKSRARAQYHWYDIITQYTNLLNERPDILD